MVIDYNTSSFTWRGLYEFNQHAVQEIMDKYWTLKDYREKIKIDFDPTQNSFTLTAPRSTGESAYQSFVEVMYSFIDRSTSKDAEGDKKGRIRVTRAIPTRLNVKDVFWTEDIRNLIEHREEIMDLLGDIEMERDLGSMEKLEKWVPKFKNTLRECFFPDGQDFIHKIGVLTGCHLETDWTTKEVVIAAPSDEHLRQAFKKLSVTEEIFNYTYTRSAAHLINSDGRERFEIHLIPILRQATTIGKTTLFHPTNQYSSIVGRQKLASARLSAYRMETDQYENVVFACTPTYNAGIVMSDIWKDYLYTPHEAKEELKRVDTPSDLLGKIQRPGSDVDSMLASSSSQTQATPLARKPRAVPIQDDGGPLQFGARPDEDRPAEAAGNNEAAELPTLAPKRKVRGAKTSATPTAAVTSPPSRPAPASSLSYGEGSIASASLVSETKPGPNGPPRGAAVTGQGSSVPLAAVRPGTATQPSAGTSTRRPRAKEVKAQQPADDKESEDMSDNQTFTYASSTATSRVTRQPPEYKTRTLQNTQNQKAPQRKQRLNDLFVIQQHEKEVFSKVFKNAFEDARRFRGELKLEAKLGRIVFPNVSKKHLKSTYAFHWDTWDDELKQAGIESIFTDMISISPCDADFVVGLKVSGGDPLFENTAGVKEVRYEIECKTMQSVPFTVSIDAETFEFTIRGKEERFGTVLWNCPCNSWDAEFSLTGHKLPMTLQEQGRALVDAMRVDPDLRYPIIWVNKAKLDFTIVGAVCRRESRHMLLPSEVHQGHEFTLNVTENIELRIQENPAYPDTIRLASVVGIESNRLNMTWYTMGLTSDLVQEAVWKNKTLDVAQLGTDEARKALLEHKQDELRTFEAYLSVVGNLISRIDNVGFSNEQFSLHDAIRE
ncbi:hypothetical protein ABW19_dt0207794 [Dactylella cylindrospora]|nr:hypothetical protein ABW19_dt0207794 [Dactylella cylindrospora]